MPGPALCLGRGTVMGRWPYRQGWAITRETWQESQMLTMETNLIGLWKVRADTGNHQCPQSPFESVEWWWNLNKEKKPDISAKPSAQKLSLWGSEDWALDVLREARSILVPSMEIPIGRDWWMCCGGRPWPCYFSYQKSGCQWESWGQLDAGDKRTEEGNSKNAFQERKLFHLILWLSL